MIPPLGGPEPWCSCCVVPKWVMVEQMHLLCQAIQNGSYNVRPGKLRQGCISYISDHPLTEEETDQLWIETFGHTD